LPCHHPAEQPDVLDDRLPGVRLHLDAAVIPELEHGVVLRAGDLEDLPQVGLAPHRDQGHLVIDVVAQAHPCGEDLDPLAVREPAFHPLDHLGDRGTDAELGGRPVAILHRERPIKVHSNPPTRRTLARDPEVLPWPMGRRGFIVSRRDAVQRIVRHVSSLSSGFMAGSPHAQHASPSYQQLQCC